LEFEGIEVTTERTGKNGRVLFSLDTSIGRSIISMPNMVQIEYGEGYARIGIGDSYTITMLKMEFCALIGDDWGLYPALAYRRLTDETVRHHTMANFHEIRNAIEYNIRFELPKKIQEDAGRGTEIAPTTDQLRVLDY
jgi:Na+-transporting NADH:ubiquinone oxidoreductase subunit NqrF